MPFSGMGDMMEKKAPGGANPQGALMDTFDAVFKLIENLATMVPDKAKPLVGRGKEILKQAMAEAAQGAGGGQAGAPPPKPSAKPEAGPEGAGMAFPG